MGHTHSSGFWEVSLTGCAAEEISGLGHLLTQLAKAKAQGKGGKRQDHCTTQMQAGGEQVDAPHPSPQGLVPLLFHQRDNS